MAIDNPVAVLFVNERVRPLAERIIALKALMDDTLADWFASGVNQMIPNDTGEDVTDPRPVTTLTGADVNTAVFRLSQLLEVLDAQDAMTVLHKAAVRPLEVLTT